MHYVYEKLKLGCFFQTLENTNLIFKITLLSIMNVLKLDETHQLKL